MQETTPKVEIADEVADLSASTAAALLDPLVWIESGLAAMVEESDLATWDVGTAAGEAAARDFRRRCVKVRTSAASTYEKWNKPILNAQRAARALIDQINATLDPIESKWDALIKAKEARKAEERAARKRAELERIDSIYRRLDLFTSAPARAASLGAAEIDLLIEEIEQTPVDEAVYAEFVGKAVAARGQAIEALRVMFQAAVDRETAAEAERLAREEARRIAMEEREEARRIAAQAREDARREEQAAREAAAQLERERLATEEARSRLEAETLALRAAAEAAKRELEARAAEVERQRIEIARTAERAARERREAKEAEDARREAERAWQMDAFQDSLDSLRGAGVEGESPSEEPDRVVVARAEQLTTTECADEASASVSAGVLGVITNEHKQDAPWAEEAIFILSWCFNAPRHSVISMLASVDWAAMLQPENQ